jgi:hypothetical protein
MSTGISRRIVVAAVASLMIWASASGTNALASGPPESRPGKHPIVVTFTKWFAPAGFPWMTGVAGGAVGDGTFAGEVIAYNDYGTNCGSNPTPGCLNFPFTLLDAIYDVQAGERSFTALIHGGESDLTGRGTLDGAILDGWLTGALVHVEFQQIPSCSGNPAGPCFQGTIRIEPDSTNSGD